MLAINYIVIEFNESSLEAFLLYMHRSRNNVYINPFTVAYLFLFPNKKRRSIKDILLKWDVYLCNESIHYNKMIYNLYFEAKYNPEKLSYINEPKSRSCSFDIQELQANDEYEELKSPKIKISSLVHSHHSRNKVPLLPPISTKFESAKFETRLRLTKNDYNELDWKINRYFNKDKLNVFESFLYKVKNIELIDFYEICIALCGFQTKEIFEIIYNDFWKQNKDLELNDTAFPLEIFRVLGLYDEMPILITLYILEEMFYNNDSSK